MWTEYLKLKPVLDSTSLKTMVNRLNSRFTKVAKRFGRGLKNVLKSGAIIGSVSAIADKLLNPLKETQAVFDRILQNSDSLATNAKLFETSAGRLFKLQEIGRAAGIQPELMFQLLQKFQLMLARTREEQAQGKQVTTPLAEFTDETDMAEAFFKYIQSIKQASADVRTLANARIFGDELPLRAAELFQIDPQKILKDINALDASDYDASIDKIATLSDLTDKLAAKRNLEDMINKANVVNEGMVLGNDRTQRQLLQQENIRLKSYESLKSAEESVQKITNSVEQGFTFLYTKIPFVIDLGERFLTGLRKIGEDMVTIKGVIQKIGDSKIVRGIGGWFK